MTRELSEKQLAAQRQNAQHSTGPRTPEGKASVRFNAVKSGLTAQNVVITNGRGKEDVAEFEAHQKRIWDDCAPIGFREEYCVAEIVRLTWRLQRGDRFENGCIQSRIQFAQDETEVEASRLPDSESLQLLLRYQTTLWRRLDTLFEQLRRLQRRRTRARTRATGPNVDTSASAQIIDLKQNDTDGATSSTAHAE